MSKEVKPKLNVTITEGDYYWVKPFSKSEFEPAKCKDRYRNGLLWFCFTDGSVMEIKSAWAVEPLKNYFKV